MQKREQRRLVSVDRKHVNQKQKTEKAENDMRKQKKRADLELPAAGSVAKRFKQKTEKMKELEETFQLSHPLRRVERRSGLRDSGTSPDEEVL